MFKRSVAVFLALAVVLALVASFVGFRSAPAEASSAVAQTTVSHISWSPSRIDNNPTFTATLKGHGFPADDVDSILVSIDATLGGICASATFATPVTNSDGSWSTLVHFTNCFANNNIVASAVDDHHLNHATLHIN